VTFSFRPAVRENVPLIIALAGPSGGGKTFTALKMARGLVGGDDSKILVIDTENGRALHYAPAPEQSASGTIFRFQHLRMREPFDPNSYAEIVLAADKEGAGVIIIDSASHVWNGVGGVLDWQQKEHEEAIERRRKTYEKNGWAFKEWEAVEATRMSSWIKPKMAHKQMMARFLQVNAHLIFCLRAEEKLLMTTEQKNGHKKTKVVPAADRPLTERWEPICEKGFMYEMVASILLLPDMPGVARPVKLQDQHRHAFPLDVPIDERTGLALAEWADGGNPSSQRSEDETDTTTEPEDQPDQQPPTQAAELLKTIAGDMASKGRETFGRYWKSLSREDRQSLRPIFPALEGACKRADDEANDADDDNDPLEGVAL